MESADLLSLPLEMIQHLSSYLSVREVVTLSQTCRQLRAALNSDVVWQRYLPSKSIPHLDKQEQRLLEQSYSLQSHFYPPCHSWQLYMKRTQIMNNWSGGYFEQYSAKSNRRFVSGVFNKPKGKGQLIYKDRFLFLSSFINDIESNAIEVWDIEKTPFLHHTIEMKEVNYECFFLIGDYLVVAECLKVVVYHITLPDKAFPVAFTFFIPEEEIVKGQNVDHPTSHNFNCVGWRHYTVGQYFISISCGEPFLHVWDIFNASKLGTFLAPIVNCFSIVLHSHDENNLLLDLTTHLLGDGHHYCYFNLLELTFSDVIFSYVDSFLNIIFYNNHVILFKNAEKPNETGFYDQICIVYDLKSAVEIKRRRFKSTKWYYNLDATEVVNGTFVLLCLDCFQVVSALTLETIDYFSCDNLKFITYHFNVFGRVFIVACDGNNSTEVWSVQKRMKVSNHLNEVYTGRLYLNDIFTILVSVSDSKISVLHFG